MKLRFELKLMHSPVFLCIGQISWDADQILEPLAAYNLKAGVTSYFDYISVIWTY